VVPRGIADNWASAARCKEALRQRVDFLAEQGLAEHRGQRVILARNLLATLRGREIDTNRQEPSLRKPGWRIVPWSDGQRVTGTYRRSVHARQRTLRDAR
jgi:hypothetical protein